MTTGGRTDSSTSTTAHPKSNDDRGRTASPHAVASIHTPAPEMQLMTVFLAIFSDSVSIHTPAWGATIRARQDADDRQFQFTHPHGVRQLIAIILLSQKQFQFTHPHGVRHTGADYAGLEIGFNSRTRMGCDGHNSNNLKESHL